ncbi:hypothetical protein LWI28_028946 [Acer negundo]|uniref:Uncharacterized protein n=1 Tax=Acer negundo TaxID=4023 RepID=A0AAD5P2C7_ACENE|nr:hypothetical protein LWI28_028946 [Acer negundo]
MVWEVTMLGFFQLQEMVPAIGYGGSAGFFMKIHEDPRDGSGQGIGNRNAQERFQRSSETVSRYFDMMLDILYEMAKVMIKPLDLKFRSTPQEILSDYRYMHHFKILIWILINLVFQILVMNCPELDG